jgi:pilus assembly protein CpaE
VADVIGTVGLIGAKDRQIEDLIRQAGMRPLALQAEDLASARGALSATPDVVVVDVRSDRTLLSAIAGIKRRHPSMGVAIIVPALEPELMLQAMRAGVTECVADPVTRGSLEAAISRVMVQRAAPVEGRVFAIIGAKGGVGSTTIAVNLAEAIARSAGETLLVDLHVATGDAAVFLGVDPRFTVLDALENTARLDENFFRGLVVHTPSGLDLLGSAVRVLAGHIDPQRVRTLIDFAVRYYRAIVLDVPRGDPSALDALEAASSIFVVVNHELPTLSSAYRIVSRLRQKYGSERISLLVNRFDRNSDIAVSDIEKAVNAKVKHVFPSEYKPALAAANHGQPLARTTDGRLAVSFHELVRTLTGPAKPSDDTKRLFGWLTPRRSQAE